MTETPKSKLHKCLNGIQLALSLLLPELLEELLEQALTTGLGVLTSLIATKVLAACGIFITTQVLKKAILVISKKIYKKCYKKIFKGGLTRVEKFKELISYIKRNKKTITGTIANIITSLGGGTLVGGGMYIGAVEIPQWALILVSIIISIVMFVLIELGVLGKGIETQEEYGNRKLKERNEKEQKAIEKEALKEIKAEKLKETQTQSEQHKAQIKAEQEAIAKIEKERLETERRAKIESAKAKILAEQQNQN